MKKLLACGLILSTLMSFGSIGFAAGLDHEEPDLCCYSSELLQGMALGGKGRLIKATGSSVRVIRDENGKVCSMVEIKNGELSRTVRPISKSRSLDVRIDATGKTIVSCEVFLNLGDGTWFYGGIISAENPNRQRPHLCFHYADGEAVQLKVVVTYSDGSSDTIKFLGSEVLENVYGELDCGPVCIKDIKPVLKSAFTPSNSQYYTVISED